MLESIAQTALLLPRSSYFCTLCVRVSPVYGCKCTFVLFILARLFVSFFYCRFNATCRTSIYERPLCRREWNVKEADSRTTRSSGSGNISCFLELGWHHAMIRKACIRRTELVASAGPTCPLWTLTKHGATMLRMWTPGGGIRLHESVCMLCRALFMCFGVCWLRILYMLVIIRTTDMKMLIRMSPCW